MKTNNYFRLATIIVLIYSSFSAISQQNVIKLGIVDLMKYNIGYERAVNEDQSFQINIAILPSKDVPDQLLPDDVKELNLDSKFSGYSILPEYRFYYSKKDSPRGFYLAPYLKYSKYTGTYIDNYSGANYQVEGNYSSVGLGLQLGVQWIISDAFTIDWYFAGFEIDRDAFSLEFTTDAENVNFEKVKSRIAEEYSDIPFIGSKLSVTSGDNFVKGKAGFIFPGLRTGFSIGFAF